MGYLLTFVMLSLGVARATRLVVADTFPPIMVIRTRLYRLGHREELITLADTEMATAIAQVARSMGVTPPTPPTRVIVNSRWEWLGDLVTCAWCASGWLSLVAVAWAAQVVSLPLPVAWWGAVWVVAATTVVAIESWFNQDDD